MIVNCCFFVLINIKLCVIYIHKSNQSPIVNFITVLLNIHIYFTTNFLLYIQIVIIHILITNVNSEDGNYYLKNRMTN